MLYTRPTIMAESCHRYLQKARKTNHYTARKDSIKTFTRIPDFCLKSIPDEQKIDDYLPQVAAEMNGLIHQVKHAVLLIIAESCHRYSQIVTLQILYCLVIYVQIYNFIYVIYISEFFHENTKCKYKMSEKAPIGLQDWKKCQNCYLCNDPRHTEESITIFKMQTLFEMNARSFQKTSETIFTLWISLMEHCFKWAIQFWFPCLSNEQDDLKRCQKKATRLTMLSQLRVQTSVANDMVLILKWGFKDFMVRLSGVRIALHQVMHCTKGLPVLEGSFLVSLAEQGFG